MEVNSYIFQSPITTLPSTPFFEIGVGGGIPHHSKAVEVHHHIPCFDIVLRFIVVFVWEKFGKVMV